MIYDFFPDISDYEMRLCADFFDEMRLNYGFSLWIEQLRVFLMQAYKQYEFSQHSEEKKAFSLDAVLLGLTINDVFALLKNGCKELALFEKNGFSVMVFLATHFDALDDEEKKMFLAWFDDLLAWYKEWRVLDIYEVTIWEDGVVVVKWVQNWQAVVVHWFPGVKQFQVQAWEVQVEDLKKISDDLYYLKPYAASTRNDLPPQLSKKFVRRKV